MIKNKRLLAVYKLAFALLGTSALATEIAVLISRGEFNVANFCSFFTVESNTFAAIMLLVSGFVLWRGRKSSMASDMLRGASTLYMLTTGIVFSVLLAGLDSDVLTAVPWDNTVLHYIMPVVLLVDWVLDPPTKRVRFARALVWLLYPVAYLAYCLVRGAITDWYPYPFLNPATKGYMGIFIAGVGITAVVMSLTWGLTRFSARRST